MLNSLQTADPFETWHKNRSSLKDVLFVFKIFKMVANIKIKKIVKNSKMKRFQWKWIFTGSKTCCTIWCPFWIQNDCQNTKILRFGRYRHDRVKNWALIISCYVLTLFFIHTTSICIVRLGDICRALRYSSQYLQIDFIHYCNLFFIWK